MINANASSIEAAFIAFAICMAVLVPAVLLTYLIFAISRRHRRAAPGRSFFEVIGHQK